MECPKCGFSHPDQRTECFRCGIIFNKFKGEPVVLSGGEAGAATADHPPFVEEIDETETESADGWLGFFLELALAPKTGENVINFGLRGILLLALTVWGLYFIVSPLDYDVIGGSFLHNINLPFHEAGHVVFRPFGAWITSLGGTLGQLLMPLICMGVLLLKTRDAFGAAVTFWWFGQNFIDIAPYIADARAGVLPLLGGNTGQTSPYGFHDWEFILGEIGMSRYDEALGIVSHWTGSIIMLLACAWGAWLLWKQWPEGVDWG
ncbi:MAG: zinc ribbon domain-containing protein [Desulfococcaceae bacterium]